MSQSKSEILKQSVGVIKSVCGFSDADDYQIYLNCRQNGDSIHTVWTNSSSLEKDIAEVAKHFSDSQSEKIIEACALSNFINLKLGAENPRFKNADRGLLGIEIQHGEICWRITPTEILSRNSSFARELKRFLKNQGLKYSEFRVAGSIRMFFAHQFVVDLNRVTIHRLFRGSDVVKITTFSKRSISEIIDGMSTWLSNNFRSDGAVTYKYWPSTGEEPTDDNAIRRFMATISLIKLAEHTGNKKIHEAAQANLEFNLRRFYREEGELGLIELNGVTKLGSIALAALAILLIGDSKYEKIFKSLNRTIDVLSKDNGSFQTFLRPSERLEGINFYPGETLLLWAEMIRRKPQLQLLDRFYKSFHYYKAWHLKHRNPAFIPWHSQAYRIVFSITQDVDLRNFIFEMNDWLLSMQQWGPPLSPDMWGRFYAPEKRYGPPHASSTGVYIEGLVDAHELAKECGDDVRTKNYERAIWRAARSIRQLQYRDNGDCFYVREKRRVIGGIRTEVYNNEIRVDNIQHALMGLLKFRPDFDRAVD